MKATECLIILTWWGCSTVRTMVSLQRLWKDSREWSGLDNVGEQRGIGRAAPGPFFCSFFFIALFCVCVCACVYACVLAPLPSPSFPCMRRTHCPGLCWSNALSAKRPHYVSICCPFPTHPSPPTHHVVWLLPLLAAYLPTTPPAAPLPPGTVKDVTLQGLWLSLGARRSPSPR